MLFSWKISARKEFNIKIVNITIIGGAVQKIKAPKGIKVIIKDYDFECSDMDSVKKDENGECYKEIVFIGK